MAVSGLETIYKKRTLQAKSKKRNNNNTKINNNNIDNKEKEKTNDIEKLLPLTCSGYLRFSNLCPLGLSNNRS